MKTLFLVASAAIALSFGLAPSAMAQPVECDTNTVDGCGGGFERTHSTMPVQDISSASDENEAQADGYWAALQQEEYVSAPPPIPDTEAFTFQPQLNGRASATVREGGNVVVSVTIFGFGQVRGEITPGTVVTGRDRNGNGRPDVLEKAGQFGTITRVVTGSRIPKKIIISSH